MKAIIIAAGMGNRLNPYTKDIPKCLLEIGGTTLLENLIKNLRELNIKDIAIVVGHLANKINLEGVTYFTNDNYVNNNILHSLMYAKKFMDDDVIISYSDIVYKSKHVEALKESNGDIVITADLKWKDLWELRFENPLDDAETFKSNGTVLKHIGGKTDDISEIEAQYMGLLKLTERGWSKMLELYKSFSKKVQDKLDMTAMINELLIRDIEVNVVFVLGGWCESDSYSDIEIYEKKMNKDKNWIHDWR